MAAKLITTTNCSTTTTPFSPPTVALIHANDLIIPATAVPQPLPYVKFDSGIFFLTT
jgi:hypothetical protein